MKERERWSAVGLLSPRGRRQISGHRERVAVRSVLERGVRFARRVACGALLPAVPCSGTARDRVLSSRRHLRESPGKTRLRRSLTPSRCESRARRPAPDLHGDCAEKLNSGQPYGLLLPGQLTTRCISAKNDLRSKPYKRDSVGPRPSVLLVPQRSATATTM